MNRDSTPNNGGRRTAPRRALASTTRLRPATPSRGTSNRVEPPHPGDRPTQHPHAVLKATRLQSP